MEFGRVIEIFVAMPRMVMAAAVGTVLRLERRFNRFDLRAELFVDGLAVASATSNYAIFAPRG